MNPELRKNIWLELSAGRVLTCLLVIGVISLTQTIAHDPALFFYGFGNMLIAIAAVFGAPRVAKSITGEIAENTWDFQRMSSATAWELTIGKLVGAPIFFILIGAIGVAISVLAALVRDTLPVSVLALYVVSTICMVFIVYAVALMAALESVGKDRSRRRSKVKDSFFFMVILAGAALMWSSFSATLMDWSQAPLRWWGIEFKALEFVLISAALFMLWSLLGAYRMMRAELQYKSTPLVWGAFLIFLWVYVDPLVHAVRADSEDNGLYLFGITGMIGTMCGLYYGLLLESKDIIILKKLKAAIIARDFRTALLYTPRWVVSLALLVVATACVLGGASVARQDLASGAARASSILFFAIRDAAVILSFYLAAPGHRRNDASVVVYLFLAYALLPWVLWAANAHQAAALLHPFTRDGAHAGTSLVGSMLGALAAMVFVVRLFRRRV
jgi:hypothetical protein